MRADFNSQPKPVWVSHRGLKLRAIENTRAAFDAALEAGFLNMETDLRITADGHILLLHDVDLRRVAGIDKKIAAMTRSQICQVETLSGGSLLFFDEFIELYAAYNWVLDIKPESGFQVIEKLGAWVKSKKLHDWFLSQAKFLVWDKRQEAALVETFGEVPRYANKSECWRSGLAVAAGIPAIGGIVPGRTYSLISKLGPIDLFQKHYVDQFHTRGARVLAYLPATESEAKSAVEAGFDEILTNGRPMLL